MYDAAASATAPAFSRWRASISRYSSLASAFSRNASHSAIARWYRRADGRRRQAHERLALEVVLEDVLLVAGEGAVGQAQDVVALDELGRGAAG